MIENKHTNHALDRAFELALAPLPSQRSAPSNFGQEANNGIVYAFTGAEYAGHVLDLSDAANSPLREGFNQSLGLISSFEEAYKQYQENEKANAAITVLRGLRDNINIVFKFLIEMRANSSHHFNRTAEIISTGLLMGGIDLASTISDYREFRNLSYSKFLYEKTESIKQNFFAIRLQNKLSELKKNDPSRKKIQEALRFHQELIHAKEAQKKQELTTKRNKLLNANLPTFLEDIDKEWEHASSISTNRTQDEWDSVNLSPIEAALHQSITTELKRQERKLRRKMLLNFVKTLFNTVGFTALMVFGSAAFTLLSPILLAISALATNLHDLLASAGRYRKYSKSTFITYWKTSEIRKKQDIFFLDYYKKSLRRHLKKNQGTEDRISKRLQQLIIFQTRLTGAKDEKVRQQIMTEKEKVLSNFNDKLKQLQATESKGSDIQIGHEQKDLEDLHQKLQSIQETGELAWKQNQKVIEETVLQEITLQVEQERSKSKEALIKNILILLAILATITAIFLTGGIAALVLSIVIVVLPIVPDAIKWAKQISSEIWYSAKNQPTLGKRLKSIPTYLYQMIISLFKSDDELSKQKTPDKNNDKSRREINADKEKSNLAALKKRALTYNQGISNSAMLKIIRIQMKIVKTSEALATTNDNKEIIDLNEKMKRLELERDHSLTPDLRKELNKEWREIGASIKHQTIEARFNKSNADYIQKQSLKKKIAFTAIGIILTIMLLSGVGAVVVGAVAGGSLVGGVIYHRHSKKKQQKHLDKNRLEMEREKSELLSSVRTQDTAAAQPIQLPEASKNAAEVVASDNSSNPAESKQSAVPVIAMTATAPSNLVEGRSIPQEIQTETVRNPDSVSHEEQSSVAAFSVSDLVIVPTIAPIPTDRISRDCPEPELIRSRTQHTIFAANAGKEISSALDQVPTGNIHTVVSLVP